MTKPFSLNELLARVSAMLRRAEMTVKERVAGREIEELENFRIDRGARTVHVDGEELHLAPKEFDLLSLLLLNAGKVQSRQVIIQRIWGSKFYGDHKTVDVHVRWLREKFERFDRLPVPDHHGVRGRLPGRPSGPAGRLTRRRHRRPTMGRDGRHPHPAHQGTDPGAAG